MWALGKTFHFWLLKLSYAYAASKMPLVLHPLNNLSVIHSTVRLTCMAFTLSDLFFIYKSKLLFFSFKALRLQLHLYQYLLSSIILIVLCGNYAHLLINLCITTIITINYFEFQGSKRFIFDWCSFDNIYNIINRL